MTKRPNTYALGVSTEEQERLIEQQRLYQDAKYLNFDARATVVEVGCGSGANLWVAEKLTDGFYIGVDNQPEQIKACQRQSSQLGLHNVSFYCADARELPVAKNSVDAVFCRLVLIHLPDPWLALKQMVSITRPGGRIIVIEPEVKAYRTTKPAIMKCFRARTNYIYRPKHGSIDIATELGRLFGQLGLTQIDVVQHDVEANAEDKDRLSRMLMNWVKMNKPVNAELIKQHTLTQEDIVQAEREVSELNDNDNVYQRLWIVSGIKPEQK